MSQPACGSLTGVLLLVALSMGGLGTAWAEDASGFVVPRAYPIERYEAGWNKNPFTLKTAPTVMAQDSFAKDLSIGGYWGDAHDPTVVVVNTKTSERTTLKKSKAAKNGMQLKSAALGGNRKDMVVEVTLGSETAEVRFNDDYMKQMAATSDSSTRAAPGRPGAPGQRPGSLPPGAPPGMPAKMPVPGASPATSQLSLPVPPQGVQNRGVPNAGIAGRPMGSPASVPMTTASRANVNLNTPGTAINPTTTATAAGAVVAPRRRLIAPATPSQVQQ